MDYDQTNEIKNIVDRLTSFVAGIDGANPQLFSDLGNLLSENRVQYGNVSPDFFREAEAIAARLREAPGEFDSLYPQLCDIVERMQKSMDNDNACAPAGGLSAADAEELEMQVYVLSEMIEDADVLSEHILGVAGDLFEKMAAIGTLPVAGVEAAQAGAAASLRALSEDGVLAECHDIMVRAARRLQALAAGEEFEDDDTAGEVRAESEAALPAAQSAPAEVAIQQPARNSYVDITNPELPEFVTESREYLQMAEVALIALEKNPENREPISEIFRGFHNIKGIAGFLNLGDVQELAHDAESLLDKARSGGIELAGECAHAAFAAVDMLKEMVERVNRALGGAPYETPQRFGELVARLKRAADTSCSKDGEPRAAAAPEQTAATPQTNTSTAETPVAANSIQSNQTNQIAQANQPMQSQAAPDAAAKAKARADGMVKVSTSRLDSLIDAVGELVIANAMVTQENEIANTGNARLARNVSQLGKITRELQELAMSMRMVSLRNTFQKMSRVARDLSVKSGVPVEFTYSGEDTELDRNVVEEISSPLVHMVRNAVDHGIEDAAARAAAGKPEKGRVHLSAFHEGGAVVIRIEDDGKGLHRDAILAKARAQGIVKADAELTDKEILHLIFQAGFSTAETVTDISGRGVGMDVVRKSIETLRGRIDIESTPGRGTTFTIRLPLTLAIIDGMVVTVASERYIVPTIAIQESMRPSREQLSTVIGRGEMVSLRGSQLPLYRLHNMFGIPGAKQDPTEALTLIIGENGSRIALMVDDLVGQQQVVIKSLGKTFDKLEGVSGGAIMGDGRVALILDAGRLASMVSNSRGAN